MRVYVASSTANIDRVEQAYERLEELGHTITHKWTLQVRELGDAEDKDLTPQHQHQLAQGDFRGVKNAELVVVLGHPAVCGALIELGMAIALRKRAWVVGEFPRVPVFFHMGQVTIMTEDEFEKHVTYLKP